MFIQWSIGDGKCLEEWFLPQTSTRNGGKTGFQILSLRLLFKVKTFLLNVYVQRI